MKKPVQRATLLEEVLADLIEAEDILHMLTGLAIPCFTTSYKVVNFPHDPLCPLNR